MSATPESISNWTPILVGVGQAVSHWDGRDLNTAPSPLILAREATLAALEDTGANGKIRKLIDTIAFVRLNIDSVPGLQPPFGNPDNLPGSIGESAGLAAKNLIYSVVGGDQPQALVNEFAEKLFEGSVKGVLLTGSEAIGAEKLARKKGLQLDWSLPSDVALEDRGRGPRLLAKAEIAGGLGFPLQTYPLFENALRARLGQGRAEYLQNISKLFEPFSEVAAHNPYSQFPVARSAKFLATESTENFRVTDAYLKWHVAQDAVNQGAAVIMTTVGAAREAGIPTDKWVYLHGYAKAQDLSISERPDLSRSRSLELSLERALSSAAITPDEIAAYDLYSCFPCVVQLAVEALGIDPERAPLTVTGGLPFFGGAGNNYSMHAIASMVEQLRDAPGTNGLVLANGGFMSKHAVGIYSTTPKANWAPVSSDDLDEQIESGRCQLATEQADEGCVEAYAVPYGRNGPERGFVISQSEKGRSITRFDQDDPATLEAFLAREEPIGTNVGLNHKTGESYVCL